METPRKTRVKKETPLLERFYTNNDELYEISMDEAGRGCMFGRVYIASVVLPKNPELFSGVNIKDSKKFSSKTKLREAAEYIKQNALVWHIEYADANEIDDKNILMCVMEGMHKCIRSSITKVNEVTNIQHNTSRFMAIVDGNYFKPYCHFDSSTNDYQQIPHVTVEKGDGKYMAIAAASILAKTARDDYVLEMCEKYPILSEKYGLDKNVGYGTKAHMSGINEHGITQWHRRSFGCCKTAMVTEIE
jgi:ribonuclease HII